ncbi:HPP family-domain-containing protein [Xylariomycetidae sp. FL0641]|nr:HPP family-domain-containing protein [Xylariomycetidae sp. FL0641]
MSSLLHQNFDIDRYLNPLIPSPPWARIPQPIAHFLGHRNHDVKTCGNLVLVPWAAVGIFLSLILIQIICHQIAEIANHGPMIVASFGAAAVLEFYATESPFSQPRNFFLSQITAAIIGVSCSKLFQLSGHFDDIRWLGGALACAVTTAIMGLTKTVHPPAGATALISVVDDAAVGLGWEFIGIVVLSCAIMMAVALLTNNVFCRFPLFWWTPAVLKKEDRLASVSEDEEKQTIPQAELILRRHDVLIPDHVELTEEERLLLDRLRDRL